MKEQVKVNAQDLKRFYVALFDNITTREMERRFIWIAESKVPLIINKNTMIWSTPWPGMEGKHDKRI